ncbi:unannotated protein [freshwater metagenome]|uniref:Unannotated protein n=1 Tax=freshwater metagenome TaxID=449393 RepID=A0A6J6YFF9_9ZZZZ|nr:hypothetical protein [Actinomycetota bacterium]MSW62955.1 hypothetical protein [Actinomycetota bacterium]MSX90048.1 hypothetical protein [Actinomycetota bacterium]MSZ63904.1 hypothetical protein [Actinomycetota bacterium]MTA57849.1 hypothetical protein [Actinomycetota bacterium]
MRTTGKLATVVLSVLISTIPVSISAHADSENSSMNENQIEGAMSSCAKGVIKNGQEGVSNPMAKKKSEDSDSSAPKFATVVRDAQRVQKSLRSKSGVPAQNALAILTTALNTYNTNITTATTTYNNFMIVANSQCETSLAPLRTALNLALTNAKNTMNAVLVNAASTNVQKKSAKDANKVAVRLANLAFTNSAQTALTKYVNDTNLARLTLTNSTQMAEQVLKNAIQTARLALNS